MTKISRGISFIEMLISVAVISITLGSLTPSIIHLMQRSQATIAHNWIISSIIFSRQTAVTNATMTTLCPSSDGIECGGEWHDGTIAFLDFNKNAALDTEDRIVKRFLFPLGKGSIKWRSFRRRNYLQLTSSGYTNFQNGNFVYCSADQDPRYRRKIIINMQGRTRTLHHLKSGQRITC